MNIVKREMTMSEVKELPDMLGVIASQKCEHLGEYKCTIDGVKTHIVLKKGMSLSEIKEAVDNGNKVFYDNPNYEVIKDSLDQYLVKCLSTNYCIGLTWLDGITLNGKEEEFYLAPLCNTKIYSLEDLRNSI